MPAATETPAVTLSFANNFWGKEDAGVPPMLDRMQNAKTACDEIKAFYSTRAAIEDEYARKLQALARKPLGSGELGSLRISLDVVRREVESMAKAHQSVANQMKLELDEQLTVHAGGFKERRKVLQTGIEKLFKIKCQQTATLNKTRDKYENDCLKIKGFTAQSHMVMGQEERKNRTKLEKTYAQMATTSGEYQAAVTALEETTGRWNREWKNTCDKFQDLEEERIDYLKSSLWNFANISSTVCVTDDQACENIRLSLEKCDVEKDIVNFIKVAGTGQEIPDPPKFIEFCREDANDAASEASEGGSYKVAQFPRPINPATRQGAASPQPSILDSHHDPSSGLARELGIGSSPSQASPGAEIAERVRASQQQPVGHPPGPYGQPEFANSWVDVQKAPRNGYPQDGVSQFNRSGGPPPLNASDLSGSSLSYRPSSRDSQSEVSGVSGASFTSYEPSSGAQSPVKHMAEDTSKKTPWYKSPFSRSKGPDSNNSTPTPTARPASRNTWGAGAAQKAGLGKSTPTRPFGRGSLFQNNQPAPSPEPVDFNAQVQLNVGNNVFDVSPDGHRKRGPQQQSQGASLGDAADPLEQALADLSDITSKVAQDRSSTDHHFGLRTPGPGTPLVGAAPPPAYGHPGVPPVSHLGAPPAAHTARDMHAAKNRYVNQRRSVYDGGPGAPPQGHHGRAPSTVRATSPAPVRATSPKPGQPQNAYARPPSSQGYANRPPSRGAYASRATSPNPYAQGGQGARPRANTTTPQKGPYAGNGGSWGSRNGSPGMASRAVSPQPQGYHAGPGSRPASRMGPGRAGSDLSVSVHGAGGSEYGGSVRGRPQSQYFGGSEGGPVGEISTRVRSKSVAETKQYTKDGRPILHYARAMYMYQAQIPEELGFTKGDVLAVLRLQDDGWWEAEVPGQHGARGLVPSNYLQACPKPDGY